MQFEVRHEFDAPLDAVALALMSPELGRLLAARFAALESVEAVEHTVDGREFLRVWRFHPRIPMKVLQESRLSREILTWDERASYRLDEHMGEWQLIPRGTSDTHARWRKHFRAEGTYRLERLPDGRTRRVVMGDVEVGVKVVGAMVERVVTAERRKAYEAEADAIRQLCALA